MGAPAGGVLFYNGIVACISVTLCDLGHNRKLHDQSQDVFACHVVESLRAQLAHIPERHRRGVQMGGHPF